jgi:hypothetical protein
VGRWGAAWCAGEEDAGEEEGEEEEEEEKRVPGWWQ